VQGWCVGSAGEVSFFYYNYCCCCSLLLLRVSPCLYLSPNIFFSFSSLILINFSSLLFLSLSLSLPVLAEEPTSTAQLVHHFLSKSPSVTTRRVEHHSEEATKPSARQVRTVILKECEDCVLLAPTAISKAWSRDASPLVQKVTTASLDQQCPSHVQREHLVIVRI